jgi:uncharacterized protein YkwD
MERSGLVIGLIVTALLIGAPAAEERTADALLAAHNRQREVHGRRPLTLSAKLVDAAALHTRDMAKRQKLEHKGADGSTVVERVKSRGYAYLRVGENVAAGQNAVSEVMKAWMESPGHRENILADFAEMGAASAADSNGKRYWCVVFARPMPRLDPGEAAAEVVSQINSDRKARGRPVLRVVPSLGSGAMALSTAMAHKDSFKIEKDPFDVLADQGAEMHGRELKISLGSSVPTPEEAAKTLVGDEAALIDNFREIGVGYAVAKTGTPYWCAVFSRVAPPERPKSRQKALPAR